MIERLKALVEGCARCARRQLEADGNGRRCAAGLSHFQDELVRLLYDYTVAHVYRATNPSDAERMAIVATGGYGRGLLAPGSDIDLLFLLPYKQTPWGESVAEYMLYMLWDLGFKVGHATRTVDQCIKLAAPTSPSAPRCSMRAHPRRRAALRRARGALPHRVVARHGARLHRRQDGRAR